MSAQDMTSVSIKSLALMNPEPQDLNEESNGTKSSLGQLLQPNCQFRILIKRLHRITKIQLTIQVDQQGLLKIELRKRWWTTRPVMTEHLVRQLRMNGESS